MSSVRVSIVQKKFDDRRYLFEDGVEVSPITDGDDGPTVCRRGADGIFTSVEPLSLDALFLYNNGGLTK